MPVLIWLPWILFQLRSTSALPAFWVRSSSGSSVSGAASSCKNLDATVPDPYWRAPPHGDRKLQVLTYCEDVELVPSLGVALISCDPGRALWNTVMGPLSEPEPRGALWTYAYQRAAAGEEVKPQIVKFAEFPERFDFHPLGMTTYEDKKTGEVTLFVVNHKRERSTIEVFGFAPKEKSQTTDGDWVATCT